MLKKNIASGTQEIQVYPQESQARSRGPKDPVKTTETVFFYGVH